MAVASAIGVPLAVLVSSGALIGRFLQQRFQAGPWVTALGVALGALLALLNVVRVLSYLQRREDEDQRGDTSNDDIAGGRP
jgi:F0F1-type ATP synthase assembly protein I